CSSNRRRPDSSLASWLVNEPAGLPLIRRRLTPNSAAAAAAAFASTYFPAAPTMACDRSSLISGASLAAACRGSVRSLVERDVPMRLEELEPPDEQVMRPPARLVEVKDGDRARLVRHRVVSLPFLAAARPGRRGAPPSGGCRPPAGS